MEDSADKRARSGSDTRCGAAVSARQREMRGAPTRLAGPVERGKPSGPKERESEGGKEIPFSFYFLFFYFKALSNHFKSNLNSFWV